MTRQTKISKREFLKSLGVEHVYSSRTTAFAEEILADTNREGANLLSLQTRQQLSSVSLSLAANAEQNVLRLF